MSSDGADLDRVEVRDVVVLRRALESVCLDLGLDDACCPYFDRYESLIGHDPKAICIRGCRDEPSCVTDQPTEGWPSMRLLEVVHDWLGAEITGAERTES